MGPMLKWGILLLSTFSSKASSHSLVFTKQNQPTDFNMFFQNMNTQLQVMDPLLTKAAAAAPPHDFTYNPNSSNHHESYSAVLQIHAHHARNIKNICIYQNQDVYANFSLTYDPDHTLSTRVVRAGGRNPDFNQDLIIKVRHPDALMKCEIWMLSRLANYMDDQLLGFALVPVSSLSGKGRVTRDFDLSSTDLFHSPAGTVKLSLSLSSNTPLDLPFSDSVVVDDSCPVTSELLVDNETPDEYCRVEFLDMHAVNENKQMVSEYFARNGQCQLLRPWLQEKPDGSFLHLGALPIEDCDMGSGNSPYEYRAGSVSADGSVQNSDFLSSTMTSFSDDRTSVDSSEKKGRFFAADESANEEEIKRIQMINACPVGSVKLEAEDSVIQKQIVDMYMKSMHQFTESIANMKLPMYLDKPGRGDLVHNPDENIDIETKEKKDNNSSRVFYGSRAFF